jgi:hypothetical protein
MTNFQATIPSDCVTDGEGNYVVTLKCPDGSVCKILVPIDPKSYEGEASRYRDKWHQPVGLNLVCTGHYT